MKKGPDYYKELLQVSYENDKSIRGIIRFSGLSEFFNHFVSDRVKEIRVKRSKTFFDQLQNYKIELTQEIIESEDFLHKFIISYKAAINSRQREKIRMFARIFNSSLEKNKIKEVNIFEDYLQILDELSYREIQTLIIYDSFFSIPRKQSENDLKHIDKIWLDFEKLASKELNIPEEEVNDYMQKISRTGCYNMFQGNFHWVDTGAKGFLTPTFDNLKAFALDEGEETI
ncbi:MAG: hypothetical protein WEA56_01480 [Balneolaceae bacterium]